MRRVATLGIFLLAALTLFGQSPDVLVRQAQEDIKAGRYPEAEKELSRAVQAQPANWKLWSNLGVLRVQLGENERAIEAFLRARKADPQKAPPYFGLGLAYMKEGNFEKATEAYRSGLARDSNDLAANQNYAYLLTQEGDFRDAIEPLSRLKRLEPGDIPTRATLIEAYLKAGLKNEAERETAELLGTHSATMQQELSLARMLLSDGDSTAATEVLRHATTKWPDAAELHGNLGLLLLQGQQYEAAASELGRAAQLDPDSAQFALGLGEVLLRWRHDPVALQYLLKIQSKFGDLPPYKFELGVAYFNLTEFPLALKQFENLAQEQPQSAQVQFLLAATQQELGQLDKAETCYRKAIALKQDDPGYYLGLASLLRKLHPADLAEPVRLTEKALALSPDNEQAKLLLASCYQAEGKLTEAQALLESVVARDPGSRTAHVALAQLYFRQKRVDEAQQQESIAAKLEERKQNGISPWGPGGVGRP